MKRCLIALTLVACAACMTGPPLAAPAPRMLSAARPPRAVVNAAAETLAIHGFSVLASDAAGGVLTAERKATPRQLGSLVTCRFSQSAAAFERAATTYTVNVIAKPADGGGSTATIASRVHVDFGDTPPLTLVGGASGGDGECVSTGELETAVSAAITQ